LIFQEVRLADVSRRPDAETIARLRDGIRIVALRALGSPDAAEDVAQETLARTLAALESDRLADPDKLPAFVHGIARHVIADVHRSRQRAELLNARFEDTAQPNEPDALDAMISSAQMERVRCVLEELSPRDREILRLSFFDGLAPTQIAELKSVPPPTIRKQKSRALEHLRRAFFASSHDGGRSPTIHQEQERTGLATDETEQLTDTTVGDLE
jgi:RNA polymerase sigma factor (sigma-70 family)